MRLDMGILAILLFLGLLLMGYAELAVLAALLFVLMMGKKEKQRAFQDFEPPKGEGYINLLDITKDSAEFSAKFVKKSHKKIADSADKIVTGAAAIVVGMVEGAKIVAEWIREQREKAGSQMAGGAERPGSRSVSQVEQPGEKLEKASEEKEAGTEAAAEEGQPPQAGAGVKTEEKKSEEKSREESITEEGTETSEGKEGQDSGAGSEQG